MTHPNESPKSATTAYLLWFFLGSFGAHRFYMGRKGSGFGFLGLTIGSILTSPIVIGLLGFPAIFVWWIVDAFLIGGWLRDAEGPAVVGTTEPAEHRREAA
jgi:TM2 domain-containing membrane protein YozV